MKRFTVDLVDVGGSFKRFLRQAPKVVRETLHDVAIEPTTVQVAARIRSNVHVSEDSRLGHVRDAIGFKTRGLVGQAGILDAGSGTEPGSNIAWIALFEEYHPNQHPFMSPAAQDETTPFKLRAQAALKRIEAALSV